MMRRPFLLLFALAVSRPLCEAQTPQQARALPTAELARLVLGEVGKTIIDVDRPFWVNHCGGPLCPPVGVQEQQRRGPAPLNEQGLTFYQSAVPTPGGLQWTGLCSSTAIHVGYEDHGRLGRVEVSKRFGLSDETRRIPPAGGPEERGSYEAELRACGKITSVAGFFYAEDETAAYRAALASRLFQRAVQGGGSLPFVFKCQVYMATCDGAKQIAPHFRVQDIHSVREAPCAAAAMAKTLKPSCYEIGLQQLGESIDIELVEHESKVRLLQVNYHVDSVVI